MKYINQILSTWIGLKFLKYVAALQFISVLTLHIKSSHMIRGCFQLFLFLDLLYFISFHFIYFMYYVFNVDVLLPWVNNHNNTNISLSYGELYNVFSDGDSSLLLYICRKYQHARLYIFFLFIVCLIEL